jgi:heptosyltransferase III
MGDIILSLPALALLRKRFPSARLTIAGNIDHLTPLVYGYADRVLSLSALPIHRLYMDEDLPPEERIFWRACDRIISWTGAGNPTFEKRMREIHPDACIGAWKPKPADARHVSQLFADSLDPVVSSGKALIPARIILDSNMREKGRRWLIEHGWNERDFLLAIHPGAGSRMKRWPLDRFIELTRYLSVQEMERPLLIEGPAERGLARHIAQALSTSRVLLIEAAPLDLLAAVIEKCRLFIGNDSGLAHLAAALNVPCMVLFGPTAPEHWAPLGSHVRVVRNLQACEGCARGHEFHTCLENITIEEILRMIAA